MSLMHREAFRCLEGELVVEHVGSQVFFQFDGDSHWVAMTLNEDADAKAIRDWFVAYCSLANIE